jgi:tol-pal system protein YbgF
MRLMFLATLLLVTPLAAPARDIDPAKVEKRVGTLESEMRAVQRKVFPGGDSKFFEPEIAPRAPVVETPFGTPASSPLVDLTVRVGELERQLRTLTGQVEANQFKQRQLEEAQTKLRGDLEFRLTALEGGGAAAAPVSPGAMLPDTPARPAVEPDSRSDIKPLAKPAVPPPAAKLATPDAAWKAAYTNVTAKNWPKTELAMTDFIAGYPKSTRLPQAQYWLGRSYALRDENALAAKAYLELYQTAPRSDRAPDALIGLADAMNGLKKPKDACRVLGELDTVYGAKLTAGQKAGAKASRTKAKCPA